ncbi:MAG: hypothetical protein AB7R00_30340 [Kofleriaceae bacterium]
MNTGQPIPAGPIIQDCLGTLSAKPQCKPEIEDWLVCINSTQPNATTQADCDCSEDQQAVMTCQ